MGFFRQHKTLCILVSSLLTVLLVVYFFGFYSVQAADISTLPVDIDCTMEYDADNVYFTVGGRTTSINRHMQVYDSGNIPYRFDSYDDFKASAESTGLDNFSAYLSNVNGGSVGFAVKDSRGTWTYTLASFLPLSVEEYREGVSCPASYWYSPSQDKVYIFTGDVYNSYSRAVKSYSSGSFLFTTNNKSCDLYVTCVDCRTDSVVYKLDRFSGCDFYSYNYAWSERSGYPKDLLCFFANHAISGFYEPDISKVNTPDYYFNYQYIFYRDGKGYTFVDSAQPLTEVIAQGSYAYLTFADSCNKYVYTSLDGISWDIKTTVSTMYGGTFTQLTYDWLYSKVTVGAVNQYDAELVYTNDDKFGKPIIKPEWADLQEVIDSLPSFTDIDLKYLHQQYFTPSSSFGSYSSLDDALLDLFHGAYVVGNDLEVPMVSNVIQRILSWVTDDVNDWSLSYSDSLLMMLLNEFTSDVSFDYTGTDSEGNMWYEARPSILNYIATISNNVYKMQSYFKNFIIIIDSRLGSIFDNITFTNTHLSTISDKLGKLSIPDYSSALSDISAKLDKGLSAPSITMPDYSDYFASIYSSLEYLNNGLLGGGASLFSSRASFSGGLLPDLYTALTDTNSDYFNSFDDSLREALQGVEFNITVTDPDPQLKPFDIFNNDNEIDIDVKTLLDTLSDMFTQFAASGYIAGILKFSPDVTNGITFVNESVDSLYSVLGSDFAPVVMLGVGFTLVSVVIKKERAR